MSSILHGAPMDVGSLKSNLPTLKVETDTSWVHLKVIQENSVRGWPNDFQIFNLDYLKAFLPLTQWKGNERSKKKGSSQSHPSAKDVYSHKP
jgi:hypothetical protein